MFCTKCGKENVNDAQFCVNCGAKLTETTSKPEAQPAPMQTQKTAPQQTQRPIQKTVPAKPRKNWGIASWVFIILQVLLLAFFFINLLFTDMENPDPVNIFLGGWIVYMFALPVGLFLIFTEAFLGAVFGVVQVCVNRSKFSWIVFGVSIGMLVLMMILAFCGVFNVGPLIKDSTTFIH